MHPQRNLIQIAEAIGDEFYYDSRRPSERGNPEKRKSAELDDMQKSMLMPKANEPGPIQPGNEPITVGHLRQAAKGLPTDHPLMQSLGKKLGRLGDHVTAIKGADPFYLIHDDIKKAVNVYRLSITPQREPVRKELNNSVEYNTKNIIEVANEIVKEQTNMGAVARTGINAINSRYKSTAGLNTLEDRLRNAHSRTRPGRHRPRQLDPRLSGTPAPQMKIDTLLQKIRDRTVEVATFPKVNGKPVHAEYYGKQDQRKRREYGDEIERLEKADRNKNVS